METASVFCPAKINLMLAVTGERSDGYREILSLAALLRFGDTLVLRRGGGGGIRLECCGEKVPAGDDNLVMRAARRFVERYSRAEGLVFELEKKVPAGAGLGGGSSDAVGALLALNELFGFPAGPEDLIELAMDLGSDCPLFLERTPVVLRGRGERVERLEEVAASRLRGRRLAVFKPFFGVSTAWAYGALSRCGRFTPAPEAERRLSDWRAGRLADEDLLYNDFEKVVCGKFLALEVVRRELRERFGLSVLLSGSGSACFCFLPGGTPVDEVGSVVRGAFGESAFFEVTELA